MKREKIQILLARCTSLADIKTAAERSRNMAAVKGKDTKPEIYIRSLLFARGYRFRKNSTKVPGHPDIWLRKYNTAIFINGCFWHRHPGCRFAYTPKSRVEFWQNKFSANVTRDSIVRQQLMERNIKCLVLWECTIRKMQKDPAVMQKVVTCCEECLHSEERSLEI